jgi:SAM-dependent methyltransferase
VTLVWAAVVAVRSSRSGLAAFVRESPIHRPAILAAVECFAAALPAGSRVLDAGAGQAPYRELFAHCDHVAHDWPASPHSGAAGADLIADIRALPLADGEFDAVLCTEVLEHVAAPDAAARELFRVLRPGGRLLVTVPFVAELHEAPHDHYRYTSFGIRGVLERVGFLVESVEPSSGYFATIAHLMRVGGLAMRPDDSRARAGTRLAGLALQAASLLLAPAAPALDRLDERRGLPLGWVALGSVPHG